MSEYSSGEKIKVEAGVTLFSPEQSSSRHYLLQDGELLLKRQGSIVSRLDERSTPVGGLELVLKMPRTTRLTAEEDSRVEEFQHTTKEFLDWLLDHPEVMLNHWTMLCRLLDHVNESNDELFAQFREIRSSLNSLFNFFRILEETGNDRGGDLDSMVEEFETEPDDLQALYEKQQEIIGHSTRAAQVDLEQLDVPDKLVKSYDPNEAVCEEGDAGDCLYILLEGNLGVNKGGQRMAGLELPGTVFGEMALLMDGQRHATIVADNQVRLARLPESALLNLVETSPGLARKMTHMFSMRYRRGWELEQALEKFLKQANDLLHTEEDYEDVRERLVEIGQELDSGDYPEELLNAFKELKPLLKERPNLGTGGSFDAESREFMV